MDGSIGSGSALQTGAATAPRMLDPHHDEHPPSRGPLYADRVKVYPRKVSGQFRQIKWAILAFCLAVYYLLPWVRWDRGPTAPDQALLIDMEGRKAYFFFIEIWPQEVYFLTGLLILAAFGLFLITSLLGRVWCGYACPQTVWTDLFMLVERLIEGDRNQRIRLDKQPWSVDKAVRKLGKHAAWLVIAAATGGAWVLYFGNAPDVLVEVFTGNAGTTTYAFIGLFTTTTYVLAGMAREQVCTYMCPWPRFQAAMMDEHSMIVTYQKWRGEPRGKHKAGTSWDGHGDCVDCTACVQVCPTGIDIRDGQQLECIGCGLCVDACNEIMRKVERPLNLITLSTEVAQQARTAGQPVPRPRIVRPRTVIYAVALSIVGLVMLTALLMRPTVDISVLRDRNPLYVTLSSGDIRNAYTIKILNKTRDARTYTLTAPDQPTALLSVTGSGPVQDGRMTLSAEPDSVATFRILVTLSPQDIKAESMPLTFHLVDRTSGEVAEYPTVFLSPAGGAR